MTGTRRVVTLAGTTRIVIIAHDMKYNIIYVIANSVQNMNYCDTVFTVKTNVTVLVMSGSACPQ